VPRAKFIRLHAYAPTGYSILHYLKNICNVNKDRFLLTCG